MTCVLLIGPPGCGKSTLSSVLKEKYGLLLIQPGEMIRDESKNNTLLGNFLKNNWNHESHSSVLINMIQRLLRTNKNKHIIIDGYPRNLEQCSTLGNITQEKKVVVFGFENCDNISKNRCLKRKRENEKSVNIRWGTYLKEKEIIKKKLIQLGVYNNLNGQNTPQVILDEFLQKIVKNGPTKIIIPIPGFLSPKKGYTPPIEEACLIQVLMNSIPSKRSWKHFPGRHAVTMTHKNKNLVSKLEYLVSIKADGERLFLLPLYNMLYSINRALKVKKLIPVPKQYENQFFLLDVEYIKEKKTFLILDVLYYKNIDLLKYYFLKRIFNIEEISLLLNQPQKYKFFPQKFYNVRHVKNIKEDIENFPFKEDGLIFTPNQIPYMEGTDNKLLKWKLCYKNTIDLIYKDKFVYGKNKNELIKIGIISPTEPVENDDFYKNDKIYECLPQLENNEIFQWILVRERPDKKQPNPMFIINDIIENIKNPIHEGEILHIPIRLPSSERLGRSSTDLISKRQVNHVKKRRF